MKFQSSRLYALIDYPASRRAVVEEILGELSKRGVTIESFVAKGFRSTVFRGRMDGREVAVKILRSDSNKGDALLKECKFLKALKGIAPTPYVCRKRFIVMEFIEGKRFDEVMGTLDRKGAKELTLKALRVCYRMDSLNVSHSELNGEKHILVSDGEVRVIDFESARFSEKPRNLLQFAGFHLLRRKELLERLKVKREELIEALRKYKEDRERGFREVEELFKGDC